MPASPEFLRPRREFRVLVVEDDESSRILTQELLLGQHYQVEGAADAEQAERIVRERPPDLILLDVVMPGRSGIELCRELKEDPATRLIPVILVTGLTEREARLQGIEAGADDFVNKPLDSPELIARVKSLLKLKQFTDELENAETVLFSLALGVEARDPYTEGHCARLSSYAAQLGQDMGLSEEDIVALRRGGVLHDIGKIAVPDAILRKPGPLDAHEMAILRRHPVTGEKICQPLRSLQRVLPIIRHHHEHWNGRGYPDGLAGEEIPILARVLQVADAYDALTTSRPYKPAWTHAQAAAVLLYEARQQWWDESILRLFLERMGARLHVEPQRRAG
ncbi:MAG: HD-GYP domain-containing protein [Terriglobales bacterium]